MRNNRVRKTNSSLTDSRAVNIPVDSKNLRAAEIKGGLEAAF